MISMRNSGTFWFILVLLGVSLTNWGQTGNIVVLDASSQKPIPFATIIVLHIKGGKTTDIGEIPFLLSKGDSVYISAVGYRDTTIVISDQPASIELSRDFVIMETVMIRQKVFANTVTVGNGTSSKSKNLLRFLGPDNLLLWGPGRGAEFAELIKLPEKSRSCWLRKAYIPVTKQNCWSAMYLSLYLIDSTTGFPGKQIFQKRLVPGSWKNVKGHIVVDFTSDSVILNDTKAIFLSVSWDEATSPNHNSNDTLASAVPTCSTQLIFLPSSNQNSFTRFNASGTYLWREFSYPIKTGSQAKFQTAFAVDVVVFR
jgi:hypothetical protein